MSRRAHAILLSLVAAIAGAALAWTLTSLPLFAGFDWDNAFHHWQVNVMLTTGGHSCGVGGTLWTCGYTAHMAVEPLYGVGALIARRLEGTTLEGMRAVNAVGIAAAAAFLVLALVELGTPAWATLLIAAAWLLTSDVVFLVRTLEDDCVGLGWTAPLLYFSMRARSRWSIAPAFASGCVIAAGTLTNYPVIVWAPALGLAGVIMARPDVPLWDRRRAGWACAIVAGFLAVILAWGAWVNLYDGAHWPWPRYLQVITASPNSDFSAHEDSIPLFIEYLARWPLTTVLPKGWYPDAWIAASPARIVPTALLFVGLAILGTVWPLRRGIAAVTAAGHATAIASFALFVCAVPAAWKRDMSAYERMDHVPLCLALLAAAAIVAAAASRSSRQKAVAALATAAVALTVVVNARALALMPRNQSWLAQFEALRRLYPPGMTFVFAESEFDKGDYDKLESLALAIPNSLIVSPHGDIRSWPFTPAPHELLDDYTARPPALRRLSPDATQLVGQH